MSDIHRPKVPRDEVRRAGFATVARLFHQAEDTDDDILLLELVDECERRKALLPNYWDMLMHEYRRLLAMRGRPTR